MPTNRRFGWQELLLALLSLVFIAVVLEVGLRVLEPATTAKVATQERLPTNEFIIRLTPNTHGKILGQNVTINADGYRGKLFPREKPDNAFRVVTIGDSHTFGTGADDESTFPAHLQQLLEGDTSRIWEVLNLGVGGLNLSQIIYHTRLGLEKFDPDLVLIVFHAGDISASNTIIIDNRNESSAAETKLSLVYRVKEYIQINSALGKYLIPRLTAVLRMMGWQPVGASVSEYEMIVGDSPLWKQQRQNILDLKQECEDSGAQLAFALFPSMLNFDTHPTRDLHRTLSDWLEQNQIPVVDLLPAFDGQEASELQISLLDIHPNGVGYKLAADVAAPFVRSLAE